MVQGGLGSRVVQGLRSGSRVSESRVRVRSEPFAVIFFVNIGIGVPVVFFLNFGVAVVFLVYVSNVSVKNVLSK